MSKTDPVCDSCGASRSPDARVCDDCGAIFLGPGSTLAARYEIQTLLGRGGMGSVFRARDLALGEMVALKLLNPRQAGDPDMIRRLQREVSLSRRARHPNVCGIYEFGEDGGLAFIVMELIEGTNVGRLLRERGVFPVDQAFDVAIQAARGLAAIHDAEIVHRDFKPSNLMLDSRGVVRVLDFGIAKAAGSIHDSTLTATGQIIGTPAYMSPEQIRGGAIDRRSDLYSLGVVVYELFTGSQPFIGATAVETLYRHLHETAALSGGVADRLPRSLVPVLKALLVKTPEERVNDAHEAVRLLETAREIELSRGDTLSQELPDLSELERDGVSAEPASLPSASRPSVTWDHTIKPSGAHTRPVGPAAAPPRAPGDEWSGLASALPTSMRAGAPVLRSFLASAFDGCKLIRQGVIQLYGDRLGDVQGLQFFALFIGSESDPEHLGTRTFLAYASPLESYLQALPADEKKVVVVVTDSLSLGAGVRQKIRDYRQQRNALVVPLYLAEIRGADQTGTLFSLLKDRVADYHSLADLFASRGPLSDATTFFGMRDLLNELVDTLDQAQTIPVICGPPGSGKTSIVKMAKYEIENALFFTLRCGGLVTRTPATLIEQLEKAVQTSRAIEKAPRRETSASPFEWDRVRLEAVFEGFAAKRGEERRPVVVLDDADWLIEGLCLADIPAEQQAALREFWGALTEQAEVRQVPLVVTGVRSFLLGKARVDGRENPFAKQVKCLEVPSLTRSETTRMVHDLGIQMNVEFHPRALRLIWVTCAGYVDMTRRLCSDAIRKRRNLSTEALPLARLLITRNDVAASAADLAALPATFESVVGWLSPRERDLLRLIAEVEPAPIWWTG